MSLPAGQQRMLDGIADRLRTHDSALASLFATFTRLTKHEEMPGIEQLNPGRLTATAGRKWRAGRVSGRGAGVPRWHVRWIALVPVAVVAVVSAFAVVLAVTVPSSPSQCRSAAASRTSTVQSAGSWVSPSLGCPVRKSPAGRG
jgi:hypothetical protein